MICQKCGLKPAASHIHSMVNGVTKDLFLCHNCAAEYNKHSFSGDSLFDVLSSIFNDEVQKDSTQKCECCGATFTEISKTGKVGCGKCYETFSAQLEPTLVKIHGRTNHIGKKALVSNEDVSAENTVEVNTDNKHNAKTDITELKEQLKAAIEKEEYEKAAEIRDIIKGMEG